MRLAIGRHTGHAGHHIERDGEGSLILRAHCFGDEGADDGQFRRGVAVGFGDVGIVIGRVLGDRNAEKDVEDEDFGAGFGGGGHGVGVIFVPEDGGFEEAAEGVVIDAEDNDVFDWLGAAEERTDILRL